MCHIPLHLRHLAISSSTHIASRIRHTKENRAKRRQEVFSLLRRSEVDGTFCSNLAPVLHTSSLHILVSADRELCPGSPRPQGSTGPQMGISDDEGTQSGKDVFTGIWNSCQIFTQHMWSWFIVICRNAFVLVLASNANQTMEPCVAHLKGANEEGPQAGKDKNHFAGGIIEVDSIEPSREKLLLFITFSHSICYRCGIHLWIGPGSCCTPSAHNLNCSCLGPYSMGIRFCISRIPWDFTPLPYSEVSPLAGVDQM